MSIAFYRANLSGLVEILGDAQMSTSLNEFLLAEPDASIIGRSLLEEMLMNVAAIADEHYILLLLKDCIPSDDLLSLTWYTNSQDKLTLVTTSIESAKTVGSAVEHAQMISQAMILYKPIFLETDASKNIQQVCARAARSLLVPIFDNEQLLFVIGMNWTGTTKFELDEKTYYTTLFSPLKRAVLAWHQYKMAHIARHMSEEYARSLETVAQVGSVVARILDLDELLRQVTELTKRNFNLYCATIFLLNVADEKNLQLSASTGNADAIKDAHYSIDVNSLNSLVALSARKREIMVVNDVSLSSEFLPNPYDPSIRAEMTVPIIAGAKLIGVLVMQSDEVNHFNYISTKVTGILADQVAVAAENARLYAEQVQAAEQLRALDRLKSQFMANMSHELRTPLNSILNFTEFVSSGMFGPVNDDQVNALTKAIHSGEHLLSLINDILDMTKIEANMMELFIEEIDLNRLLDEVVLTVEGLLRGKSVVLIKEIKEQFVHLYLDERRIKQILLNLLSNAIKFTSNGAITLNAHTEGDYIVMFVHDTGPGIAPEEQASLFAPFRQAKHGLQQGSGTGLGLAISRRLAEAHGGSLCLESQLGAGSTFYVKLPITKGD
jgi:signal transduction histidine kinase